MSHSIEVEEIRGFLARCVPFDQLPDELLTVAARAVTVRYFRQGSGNDLLDRRDLKLSVVRSGAFEIRGPDDELVDRIDEGGTFGYPALLTGDAITNRAVVLEDGLLYQIGEATFRQLRAADPAFDQFFARAYANRLRQAVRFRDRDHQLVQRVGQLISKPPITVARTTPVAEAAVAMTRERISSLLVVEQGKLVGIVTDRDLRARVLAAGLDGETPVAEIMTADPFTIAPDAYVFEAMMKMSEHNIHHLPVAEARQPVGVLTTTDLVRAQKSDPVYLIGEIGRQATVDGLQRAARDGPELLRNLIAMDARAVEIGRVATAVTDAITRQLMKQAMARLGEAPVPFVWLAFGSQARQEQTAHSDQDNGLLLADAVQPEHDAYFAALAQHVCDGLNACGYSYCHGGIMATNPRWRQPLRAWQQYFLPWINEPSPEALMHSSIFFDLRVVGGDAALFAPLQSTVLEATRHNGIFLACLASNALQITPPLGFFKQFVLERNGEHAHALDLKLRGVVPIIDIARIYALANGITAVSTVERLARAGETGMLTERDARALADAYEYIAHLRLNHQGAQLVRGERPDNYLHPESVSDLTRHQLRDAFAAVNSAQAALLYRRRATHPAVRRFLRTPPPPVSSDYGAAEFLAVDLEMTDLHARKGEIVSIGYVPVIRGEIPVGEGHAMLVRAARGVGDSAAIHGIHDRDVGTGLPLDEALVSLVEALCGRVLLLHHRTIDLAFLNRDFRRIFNVPVVAPVIDTMALERRRLAMRQGHVGREELRLYRCRERYNLPAYRSHDALVDALATAELFLAQAAHIASDRPLSLRKLLRWSAR